MTRRDNRNESGNCSPVDAALRFWQAAKVENSGTENITEAEVVRKSVVTMGMVMAAGLVAPLYAQEAAAAAQGASAVAQWSVITAGFALAFAAAFGALGQGKAVSSAVEGIARNPGAAGDIRGALILGLVLIESLVIYVLLVAFLLFFVKPFGG
jgi:F-type H+-transporting ATPase subunit c